MPRAGRIAAVLLAALVHGCGGAYYSTTPSLAPDLGPPTVMLGPAGVDPSFAHVFTERRAFFVNTDSRPHSVYANSHPRHDECGGALNLGTLQPGERREVTGLPLDVCAFHDDADPGNTRLQGLLVVH